MPVMAMAVIAVTSRVPGCTGPPSICGLPVGVAVRDALEDLRGRRDLRLGRLQDGIPGAGPSGVLRMTWVRDQLAHVLQHCETDEPSGTWTNPRELHQTGAFALVT